MLCCYVVSNHAKTKLEIQILFAQTLSWNASNKSLENSGIMMMIARSPKKEGSGGKSLLKIGEADKVDFYRIQTVLLHLGRNYAMN